MAHHKIADAAKKTGVHPSTIYTYVDRGEIPCKVIGGTKHVQLKDVLKIKPKVKPREFAPRKGKSKMKPIGDKRLVTVPRAAEITGLDRSTIYSWLKLGKIKKYNNDDFGKVYFVSLDEINEIKADMRYDGKQKVIVFEQPRTQTRPKAQRDVADRVNDLELLYYELLDKVDGLQHVVNLHSKDITALKQQPAIAELAIDWSEVERGTRVVDLGDATTGIFLCLLKDDPTVAWVMYDDEVQPQHRLISNLKLEEND